MAEITASLVKTLREKTGAGMMDCKKALSEVDGDLEDAVDWLRKKGLSAAAKKAGRIAAEGLVGVINKDHKTAAVLEVNAETDFVSRNPQFQDLVKQIIEIAAGSEHTNESLATVKLNNGSTVQDAITNLIAVIGENINLRRQQRLHVSNGVVASYIHSAVAPGLGRIGVLVALESPASSQTDREKLQELGKKIAMHIAAVNPQALDIASLSPALLEREKNILTEQARSTGRPDDVIQKMIEGRVRKYYEEVILLEQIFVVDGKTKISQVIEGMAKEIGHPITLKEFVRFALGEGIEKEVHDFAAEVRAQANI